MERLKLHGLFVDNVKPASNISEKKSKILFIHGSNGGSWYWQDYMKKFSGIGYDCYAMNLRGHYPNPDLQDLGKVSIFDYIEDAKNVLQDFEDVIVFGHSMGGLIAQKIAETVNFKAAIFACSAPPGGIKFKKTYNPKLAIASISIIPKFLLKRSLVPRYSIAKSVAMNKIPKMKRYQIFKQFVPESCSAAIEVSKGKVKVDLSNKSFPILTIGAKSDGIAHYQMEKEISDFYKSDFLLLKDNAHMFMIEPNWENTADLIIKWLESKGL